MTWLGKEKKTKNLNGWRLVQKYSKFNLGGDKKINFTWIGTITLFNI